MKKFSLWLFKKMYSYEIRILHESQASMADIAWKGGVRGALRNLDLWKYK